MGKVLFFMKEISKAGFQKIASLTLLSLKICLNSIIHLLSTWIFPIIHCMTWFCRLRCRSFRLWPIAIFLWNRSWKHILPFHSLFGRSRRFKTSPWRRQLPETIISRWSLTVSQEQRSFAVLLLVLLKVSSPQEASIYSLLQQLHLSFPPSGNR